MPAFTPTLSRSPLREAIRAMTRAPEPGCVQALMADAQLPPAQAATVNDLALRLAEGVCRATRQRAGLLGSGGRAGLVQGLLQEFALNSQEGVALMCLAERPDTAARQAVEASGAPARVPVRGLDALTSQAPLPGFATSERTRDDRPGSTALQALSAWAQATGEEALTQTLRGLEAQRLGETHTGWRALPGPTGEANLYAVEGRKQVLCLADDEADRLTQLAAVLAAGGQAVRPAGRVFRPARPPARTRSRGHRAGKRLARPAHQPGRGAAPWRRRLTPGRAAGPGRTLRLHRHPHRPEPRRAPHPFGTPVDGALAQHQHCGGGWKREPDDVEGRVTM